MKETSGGAIEKITVANVGLITAEPTIRKALAIGADDAIRIDAEPKDAYFVAAQLAYRYPPTRRQRYLNSSNQIVRTHPWNSLVQLLSILENVNFRNGLKIGEYNRS